MRRLLSENLRKARKTTGFTQDELAEASGLSLRMIQDIEGQNSWPSPDTIGKIAMAMDIEESSLFLDPNLKPSPMEALAVIEQSIRKLDIKPRKDSKIPLEVKAWIDSHKIDEGKWAMIKKFLGIPDQKKKREIG